MIKPKTPRDKGNDAETIAVGYLERQGYSVVERNFRCRVGEIDIIARHDGDLVFVEVRSGHAGVRVDPIYSVDRKKQTRIIRAAETYLKSRCRRMPTARFDVVIVKMADPPQVELVRDAFTAHTMGWSY